MIVVHGRLEVNIICDLYHIFGYIATFAELFGTLGFTKAKETIYIAPLCRLSKRLSKSGVS